LGYYLLDTRDRFNYGELMAVILVIGFLGFLSDALIRLVQHKVAWPNGTPSENW
jgi:NitT/TauT family transport system permease protein